MSDSINPFRQSFKSISTPAKLILLVFLILLFALIGSLMALMLAIPIYHCDLATIYGILENPDEVNIGMIKFFQIIQSISMFIIPALIASWLFSERTFSYLGANRKVSGTTLFMVLLSLIIAVPLLNMVTDLNARLDLPVWLDGIEKRMVTLEESAERLTGLFLMSNTAGDLLVNFLMIAILPAIGEEFLFRGVLQRLFIDWTKSHHMGILLSAFLFSFIHFQFYGFLPRLLLGMYFGYLMYWSASIWVPVAAHLINNGMAVFYYHFTDETTGKTALDTIGTGDNGNYLLYLSVFLTGVLIGMIYLNEKKRGDSTGSVIL